MKTRAVGAELFQVDGRTGFSKFCESAKKRRRATF